MKRKPKIKRVGTSIHKLIRPNHYNLSDSSGSYFPRQKTIDMPVYDGEIHDVGTLAHEMVHALMRNMGVDKNLPTGRARYHTIGAALLTEGLACIGNLLYDEAVSGRVEKEPKNQFHDFRNELVRGDSVSHRIYDEVNAWVQRYLWSERGGAHSMQMVAKQCRWLSTQKRLVAAYEKVYGEPLASIVLKAEAWYKQRYKENKILGER